ncbi:MAG: hypothetical protein J5733_00445 [Bacteroidaceae bacterium]|nr:hypothetical protein [Bacteroidaceae bacterium]
MEKIYGGNERQDALIKVSGSCYYLYYGFGKDSEEAEHGYNYRHKFDHLPTMEEVKEQVLVAIDKETSERITTGMTYEGYKVNLTVENQLNYSMFKDMGRYPVTIKVEDADGNDVALSLTREDYAAFYSGVQNHINDCVQSCWTEKTTLDLSRYEM